MGPVTHQTVRLSKGKHRSPDHGACVMELASMLAGEPFSDHPGSASPVIGSFLRAYNDSIDDERRLDLYGYAARVVGSRSTDEVEKARAERVEAWAAERRPRQWTRFLMPGFLRGRLPGLALDFASTRAVHAITPHDDRSHADVLALIDELLALGVRGGTSDQSAPACAGAGGVDAAPKRPPGRSDAVPVG